MSWRIYRLPGSREVWHIDSGEGTEIFNVHGYQCQVPSRSVDIGGNNVPRAWIEICEKHTLHLINGIAVFLPQYLTCKKEIVCQDSPGAKCAVALE